MDLEIHMELEIRYGLWTGYGILILDEMDYGLDLDKDSDPFGPLPIVFYYIRKFNLT